MHQELCATEQVLAAIPVRNFVSSSHDRHRNGTSTVRNNSVISNVRTKGCCCDVRRCSWKDTRRTEKKTKKSSELYDTTSARGTKKGSTSDSDGEPQTLTAQHVKGVRREIVLRHDTEGDEGDGEEHLPTHFGDIVTHGR